MSGLNGIMKSYTAGLSYRPDQEHTQTKIRLAIAFLIASYVTLTYQLESAHHIPEIILYAMLTHIGCSVLLFIHTRAYPSTMPLRCISGISLDLVVGTIIMIGGGASTAWIYGGFIWVIVAYGIRFGKPYLYTATVIAVSGFAFTIGLSPFWQEHLVMGIGLMAWLIVLPFYIAKLLDTMQAAIVRAEIANKAKSQFLANMSHEIRTPLTAIIGYSESSLDKDQSNEDRVNALGIIRNSGQHLLSIVNDILDFSKVEADEMDIEQIPVNLFQIMADVEAIAATQAIKKELEFKVDYQFPLPEEITGDPVRLKQILLNLCSNAVKFTKHGSVTIIVKHVARNNVIEFQISDTGIGMTPEQLKTIFKPFKQADSSTTRHYGGTGLGLSLSLRLAGLLGGNLDVKSQHGSGTTFALTVPCGVTGKMIDNIDGISYSKQNESEMENARFLSGNILLAEDNPTNRKLISMLLEKMGATVIVAENGKRAFELAKNNQFDLIYMDMQMPLMSGIDVVIALRKLDYSGPIVALTANATREDRDTCFNAGCDDYLTKPVNRGRLYTVTARYLKSEAIFESGSENVLPIHSELLHKDSIVNHLLTDFIEELSRMLANIKMAFVNEQWLDMQETVHDLKGMGGGFGFPQLSELAEQMEYELKNHSYENVREKLNDLDIMSKRIYLGKIPGSNCAQA